MTTTLDDLIARLETATGPDRELDVMTAMAVGKWAANDPPSNWQRIAREMVTPNAYTDDESGDTYQVIPADDWHILRYTASIDAALTLVPESCDVRRFVDDPSGTGWTLSQFRGGVVLTRGVGVTADLPALALCIAALKARKTESAA